MPDEDLEDMDEEYILVSRMEAGLYTLQQCAVILGHLWFHGDITLRKRILLLLHQQARTSPGQLYTFLFRMWLVVSLEP
jgi:beta-catenin-like protein 1